ncbi:hypothetical protein TTHERM_000252418 (macronuclear) [Tetrahymena thermophila SB210]|uniref:Uncharacterized protein n=1 Tax=Tetrahymena thermophila (strain SB210) TaxID=312017 RepID=W7XH25_TETTS|nr:hypothetical protein TTHERM_000252418 [Tetrahymena thermophila SB210]EWS73611.1 hypothetical protein TTHERM_000252418 [Tetrahymena thermophila SB210]|eukprot:XP_012653841.1 hypothetical protein TTHERM_000252418 [Tetrahymena thermophila SB210]
MLNKLSKLKKSNRQIQVNVANNLTKKLVKLNKNINREDNHRRLVKQAITGSNMIFKYQERNPKRFGQKTGLVFYIIYLKQKILLNQQRDCLDTSFQLPNNQN